MSTTRSALARALAVLGVIALATGAIMSIPRARAAAERRPLDIALVDVSKSVVARAAGAWGSTTAVQLREWARRAETSGHDAALVSFGRDVRTALLAQPAHALVEMLSSKWDPARELLEKDSGAGARETRLAAALNLARSMARDRPAGTLTIFGDGTFTGEDPARIAHELAEDGFTIAIEKALPRSWNCALSPLAVGRELEVGAPIVVSAVVRVDRGTLAAPKARVDFDLRDASGVRKRSVDIEVGERDLVPLHVDFGPARAGLVFIEASVFAADDIPEDDVSRTVLRCAGSLLVGELVQPLEESSSDKPPPPPWKIEGVEFIPIGPGELATRIDHLDALVTFDSEPPPDEQRAIRNFVQHGGGWLDLAGWHWFDLRRSGVGPLHDLAALVPDQDQRPRDVIFLIDASGSMAGPPFDAVRAQIGALVDSTLPNDDVSVRFFAGDVSAPIRFGTRAERADPARRPVLDEAVRTARSPGGPTRILAALETLALEHAGSGHDALVLLLSDGREAASADREARLASLKQKRAALRMRVAAVAPVADVDRELLTLVADSFVDLDDPKQWPFVFRSEILEPEVVRRAHMPVIPVVGGPEPAASLAAATQNLPPIEVAGRTHLAPGAQLLWTDDRGTPLAAFARRGSGQVVSLAFSPRSFWAPEWTTADPLAPIVRALARRERSKQPSLRVDGDQLVLENVDAQFPAAARAVIHVAEGDDLEVMLMADARGSDPLTTRTAPIPWKLDAESGIVFVHVDGGSSGDLEIALDRPRASEFAFEPRRFTPPAPRPVGARMGAEENAHPSAPASLALGVLALAAAALLGAFSARRR